MRQRWTRSQDALLRRLWPFAEMRNITQVMLRSASALKNRAHQLRLSRYANRKPYSAAEKRMLRKLFPHMSSFKVAIRMKRSVCSVNGTAHKLGLHKTTKYLASPDACRLRRGDHVGKAYQFPKGHVPANKGLRRPGYARGRMAETQFKKGQKSINWMPVGSTRINADGYLDRKIRDTGYPPDDWRGVHILLWEAKHGPLPAGHAVVFKDGNRKHIVYENLEMITRADLMRRNTIHNLPAELKDTIMLAGRLKRRIRRIERDGARHQGTA